jgi:hypothetical protein
LIILPLALNLFFFVLGGRWVSLKLLWYGFMLTAVLLAPLAVLLGQVRASDGLAIVPTATVVGVLAAVVKFFGLVRWSFLVPTFGQEVRRSRLKRGNARDDRSCLRVVPYLLRRRDRRMPRLPLHRSLEIVG